MGMVAVDRGGALYHAQGAPGGGDYPFYIGYLYVIYVFDGNSLALMGHDFGSIYRKRLGFNEYDNAAIDVDLGWRGEPYGSLPAEKKNFLRRGLYDLIDRSVPFTLKDRLHFVP